MQTKRLNRRGGSSLYSFRHTLQLESLESRVLLSGALGNLVIQSHLMTAEDAQALQQQMGVATDGMAAPPVVDGHGTGYTPPTEDEWKALVGNVNVVDSLSLDSGIAAPPSIDWSLTKYFPPIGNQDGEGSCTAFAFAYYTKTFQEAVEHDWDLSTVNWVGGDYGAPDSQLNHIFSPDFIYHQINGGFDGGSMFSYAVDVISDIGAATWSTMPYDPFDSTTWPGEAAWREAPIYRGSGDIFALDVSSSVQALKDLLASGNLAQMVVDAYDMYEMSTLDNFYNYWLNHAQTIVGYDDTIAYTEGGVTQYGAFKVANSWGPTWDGETTNDGCWWISYEAMKQRVGEVYFFEDRTGYAPETLAVFGITDADRGADLVNVGMGAPGLPIATKELFTANWGWSSDGNDAFPANLMALDITEFGSTIGEDFFLEVIDFDSLVGTIDFFSVEHYSDYTSGIPDSVNVSLDPPVDTIEFAPVYAVTVSTVPGIDLVPTLLTFAPEEVYGVGAIDVSYTVNNIGDTGFSTDFDLSFYLSDDDELGGTDDILVGTKAIVGGMGATSSINGLVNIASFPLDDPYRTDGDYYLLMAVDSGDVVDEGSYEDNNVIDTSVSWARRVVFEDDFSTDTGWTGYQADRWERGPAAAGGGAWGYPDPATDTTPTPDNNLLGYNIGGDYTNNLSSTQWITSPVIDCTNYRDVTIGLERWLNVEGASFDHAYIQAYDGTTWQTVYANSYSSETDWTWDQYEYDVSPYADGNPDFQVRFGLGPTDSSWTFSGWNIDDFQVIGTLEIEYVPPQVSSLSVGPVSSVPVNSIEVFFNENIEPTSLANPANYSLVGDLSGPITIDSVTPDTDSVVLQLNGGVYLVEDTYTLTVESDGITDVWLNPLDGNRDGVGGDDFVFEFACKDVGVPAGQLTIQGGSIMFFDTDATTAADVNVRPIAQVTSNTRGILSVTLLPQYSPFGIVITQAPGSTQPIAINDKTYWPNGISYIVADCDVSTITLGSNLTGWDLNGVLMPNGLQMPLDIDGDGNTTDLVGFVGFHNVGTFRASSQLNSDVVTYGNMGSMLVTGTSSALNGQVYVGGNLGSLQATNRIVSSITADGHIGSITALGGTGTLARINAGQGLDRLTSKVAMLGGLDVTGNVGTIAVTGNVGAAGDNAFGRYDAGVDTLIYDGGDGWDVFNGVPGVQGDLYFHDANANLEWNAGEDFWKDGTGGGLANGVYDWEYQVDDGGDGWDTLPGTGGTQGDLLFADTNGNGRFDWNEEIWKDDGDSLYTAAADTQVFPGLDGVWDTLDTTAGVKGNLYFYDTGDGIGGAPDSKWEDGEEIWADAALVGVAGQYDAVEEQRVYDGGEGYQLADGDAGLQGQVYFYDTGNGIGGPPDGLWETGEDIWQDSGGGLGDIIISGNLTGMTVTSGDVTNSSAGTPRISVGGQAGTLSIQTGSLLGGLRADGGLKSLTITGGRIGTALDGGAGDILVTSGGLGTLTVTNGDITDGGLGPRVTVAGNVGTVTLNNGRLIGGLEVNGGNLGSLTVGGAMTGAVDVTGSAGRITLKAGATAPITVGAGLTSLTSYGSVADIVVGGGVGTILISGGNLNGDLSVGGGLSGLQILNGAVTDNGQPTPRINVGGRITTMTVSGGGVVDDIAAGSIGRVTLSGTGGLAGNITSLGGLDAVSVASDITGGITAAGNIGTVTTAGGFTGTITGDSLGSVLVRRDMTGAAINTVTGGLTTVNVTGRIVNSDISVSGKLGTLSVGISFTDSNVSAGQIGTITVRGQISGFGGQEIVAGSGSFTISDADTRRIISDAVGYDFSGVHAYVAP